MELLTIGALAQASGVPRTTLRYYDQLGLLVAQRLPNGHRRYRPADLEQLQLVGLCRALGLSLEESAAVLGPDGGPRRREIAATKLATVEATMSRLMAARAVLTHLAECEHSSSSTQECRQTVRSAVMAVGPPLQAGSGAGSSTTR